MPPVVGEAPTDGQLYSRKGSTASWVVASAGAVVSDTPPTGVPVSTLWWESDSGALFINYQDPNSTQWVMGPQTMDAVNKADDHKTIDKMCDARLAYLQGLSTWPNYGKGWTARVESVRTDAHKMVDEHADELEPEPGELVVSVIISAPEGVRIDVQVINGGGNGKA